MAKHSKQIPYRYNEVYPTAAETSDQLQALEDQHGVVFDGVTLDRDVHALDPAGQLRAFATPGLPIAGVDRGSHRGRFGDYASVQPNYVSKGVLPL